MSGWNTSYNPSTNENHNCSQLETHLKNTDEHPVNDLHGNQLWRHSEGRVIVHISSHQVFKIIMSQVTENYNNIQFKR